MKISMWAAPLGWVVLLAAIATATASEMQLTLSAAGVARLHCPVSVQLDVPTHLSADEAESLVQLRHAVLQNAQHTALAQVVPIHRDGVLHGMSFHWVEAKLSPRETRTYAVRPAVLDSMDAFHFQDGDDWRDLLYGKQGVWRHMIAYDPNRAEETYKTYHHIYGFHAEPFITKGPGGLYPHHRGLFFGWVETTASGNAYNFWYRTKKQRDSQRHETYRRQFEAAGIVIGRAASVTRWVGDDGIVVGRDHRHYTAWVQPEGVHLLDLQITIESVAGNMVLDGDSAHAGVQFRADQEVANRKDATYIFPAEVEGGEEDNWTNLNWATVRFAIKGHPYAVMHIDHPDNPRPIIYNTRNYGRFGSFFQKTVKAGEPLKIKYRLIVIDAERFDDLEREDFERRYRSYVQPVQVTLVTK